jgi:hypothetical protein
MKLVCGGRVVTDNIVYKIPFKYCAVCEYMVLSCRIILRIFMTMYCTSQKHVLQKMLGQSRFLIPYYAHQDTICSYIKGTVSRDFRPSEFFIKQPPGSQIHALKPFEFLFEFDKIFEY